MLAGDHPAVPYAFPLSELKVVDLTIRMFTEPLLVGDVGALAAAWTDEELARQALLDELGVTAKELRSDDRFADMLEAEGVELETKVTNAGNEKYAFAKSDYFMQDLAATEDERIALLVEARLKVQSSIYQTRAERLGEMATRGPLCVYLAYAAAHTRRWGGGDKLNWQNFPRSDPAKPKKGALRRAIKAP
jgi:DNA polymerase